MKKLIILLLSVLVLALVFSACDGGAGNPVTTSNQTDAPAQTTEAGEVTGEHVHAFGEWQITVAPTCTSAGTKERVCSCGEKETETVAAAGHTEVVDPAVAASCTEPGKTEGKHCSVCGTVITAQEDTAALGHDYVDHVCSRCGAHQYSEGLYFGEPKDNAYRLLDIGDCTDTEIRIPDVYKGLPVTSISQGALDKLDQITAVFIPDSVTSIGNYAFEECPNLKTVVIGKNVETIGFGAFLRCPSIESIVIPDSVKVIDGYAFRECTSLTSVTIPDTVAEVNEMAFAKCDSLQTIVLPSGLTSIKLGLFEDCPKLKSVNIPSNVTVIEDVAFRRCSALVSIELPSKLTSIGWEAFDGCSSLTELSLPESLTAIGASAFGNCVSLAKIEIPSKITVIERHTFYGCRAAAGKVVIPASVKKIDEYAFGTCLFSELVICEGVTEIEENAFYSCENLSAVYYTGTEEKWDSISIKEHGNYALLSADVVCNYKP